MLITSHNNHFPTLPKSSMHVIHTRGERVLLNTGKNCKTEFDTLFDIGWSAFVEKRIGATTSAWYLDCRHGSKFNFGRWFRILSQSLTVRGNPNDGWVTLFDTKSTVDIWHRRSMISLVCDCVCYTRASYERWKKVIVKDAQGSLWTMNW
jgi:hypothetical protein